MYSGQLHECSYDDPQSSLHLLVDRLITFIVTIYIVSHVHNYLRACGCCHHWARLGIRVATSIVIMGWGCWGRQTVLKKTFKDIKSEYLPVIACCP